MKNKDLIKIPEHFTVCYSETKQMLTILTPFKKKSIKIKLKLILMKNLKTIEVSKIPFIKTSNNYKKKLKAIHKTTIILIKQLILEMHSIFYKKLKLNGIGYKVFDTDDFEKKLVKFKLGYSHLIYFRIPKKINIFCLKTTKLFIYGHSYKDITLIGSFLRSYKKPDPYKGKGILYENEKIVLKEGKKV
uniref:ribosomal protein L6 n=1 Tax=Cocconeiopsis kantsiensis TaxID=3082010 RepID=UPI0030010E24